MKIEILLPLVFVALIIIGAVVGKWLSDNFGFFSDYRKSKK